MIADFFSLALRTILNRQLRSWLTMIGIFIGVAAVVALISIGQGLQTGIQEQFATFGVDKIVVQGKSAGFAPPGALASGKMTEHDVKLVSRIKGIKSAAGINFESGTVIFEDEQKALFINSVPDDAEEARLVVESSNYVAIEGRMIKGNDQSKVVVGYNLAYGTIFDKPIRVGNKISINGKNFDVVGILKKIGDPSTDNGILMSEKVMDVMFDLKEEFRLVFAQVEEGQDINSVATDVERVMRRDRDQEIGEEDFQLQTSQQFLESFNNILNIVQAVVVGIAAISIIVGAIGIMNTMYTSVIERTKEIGVMKATGARNSHILSLFLIESGMLGIAGGTIGVAIGVTIGKLVEIGAREALGSNLLRAVFPWYLIVGALLFSFIIGAASGVLPAMQASRLKPADALRYE